MLTASRSNTDQLETGPRNALQSSMAGCRRAVVISWSIATVGAIALSSQTANQASIVFSFPLGSNAAALPTALAVDAGGNSYVTGVFSSFGFGALNFPVTEDAVQKDPASMFVAKIDASGSRLVWATYLGGHKNRNWYWRGALDTPSAIAVDPLGNVYITGQTAATDFPTMNATLDQPQGSTTDGFLVKLNSRGSQIMFSTYLGAPGSSAYARAIATDVVGNAYVGIHSEGRLAFERRNLSPPGTAGGGLVAKFNPAGGVVYATRLGSFRDDDIQALAVDPFGAAHLIGRATRPDFPLVNPIVSRCPPVQASFACSTGFAAKLDPSGTRLLYSTLLAGSTQSASLTAVATDSSGATYVAGTAGPDYPTRDAYQPTASGVRYFLTKLTPVGRLEYSTFVGGEGDELTFGLPRLLLDAAGRPTLVGVSASRDGVVLGLEHPDVPVFVSLDGGVSWTPSATGIRSTVLTLTGTSSGDELWYAGAPDGIYVSRDAGTTWRRSNSGLAAGQEETFEIAVDPAHSGTAYAGTRGGTYKTVDSGNTWTKVDPVMFFNAGTSQTGLAVDGNGVVFLGTEGIRRSRDGGGTWENVSRGLQVYTTGTAPHYGSIGPIAFDPNKAGTLYAVQSSVLFRSTDGGSSWAGVDTTLRGFHSGVETLAPVPGRPGRIFASLGYELARSDDDGVHWESLGLRVGARRILVKPRQPDVVYAAGGFGAAPLFISYDAGAHWTPVTSDLLKSRLGALSFDPRRQDRLFGIASVRSLPFLVGFDETARAIRYAAFVAPGTGASSVNLNAASMDGTGALYLVAGVDYQPTVIKVAPHP